MKAPLVRLAMRTLGVAGVLLAVVAVRVVVSSHQELEEARRLEAKNDVTSAVVHYRRAARWYAPGNPFVVEALDALKRIAEAAEERRDIGAALVAYRGIRASIMSTRSTYVPYEDRLREANQHIAALMAEQPAPPMDAAKSKDQIRREHLALLEQPIRPRVFWAVVLLLGFVSWVAGAFLFVSRALDEQDRLVRHEAARWGTVIVIGLALFVVGMFLA